MLDGESRLYTSLAKPSNGSGLPNKIIGGVSSLDLITQDDFKAYLIRLVPD